MKGCGGKSPAEKPNCASGEEDGTRLADAHVVPLSVTATCDQALIGSTSVLVVVEVPLGRPEYRAGAARCVADRSCVAGNGYAWMRWPDSARNFEELPGAMDILSITLGMPLASIP
jgi:hypothetical protein